MNFILKSWYWVKRFPIWLFYCIFGWTVNRSGDHLLLFELFSGNSMLCFDIMWPETHLWPKTNFITCWRLWKMKYETQTSPWGYTTTRSTVRCSFLAFYTIMGTCMGKVQPELKYIRTRVLKHCKWYTNLMSCLRHPIWSRHVLPQDNYDTTQQRLLLVENILYTETLQVAILATLLLLCGEWLLRSWIFWRSF